MAQNKPPPTIAARFLRGFLNFLFPQAYRDAIDGYFARFRRQFTPAPTAKQQAFDVAFGIVLPVLCLIFDPFVFRRPRPMTGDFYFLVEYRLLFYAFMGLQIASLGFYLLKRWNHPLLAVWLLIGAGAALTLGIGMLPYSFMILLYCFGMLIQVIVEILTRWEFHVSTFFVLLGPIGFTPLLTAFAFARNAVRILDKC